ncbi:hypothetical protein TSAR_009955 [Trichomalopsis sarcophagae]|uniref:Uncharacterized protein n=1 Tax=Trichomalopsis sarcophagae TaxID=543379 RepID=A0A232ENM1_9HYME|nr:hypothetical protein TSAR_009955 [Trichomalopsis sarcophagae]
MDPMRIVLPIPYAQPIFISCLRHSAYRKEFKLCQYIKKQPITVLKQRLQRRYKVNQRCNCCGESPLHVAVRLNSVELLNLLAINKARFNGINKRGETPLHVACEINNENMAARLLDLRSSPYRANNNGETCMEVCLRKGHIEVAETILRKTKADLTFRDPEDYLLMATRAGSKDFVELFLNFKANIDGVDPKGNSAISLAVELGYEDVLDCLLKRGADIRRTYTSEKNTLLHIACQQGRQDIVWKLLLAGVQVYRLNTKLETPLHLAVKHSSLYIIKMLLMFGSNLEARDFLELTPLHHAIIRNKIVTARYLLSHAASTKAVVRPLIKAMEKKYFEMVKLIVCSSIDHLQQKDALGRTIFDAAVKYGNADIIHFLNKVATEAGIIILISSASITTRDINGGIL